MELKYIHPEYGGEWEDIFVDPPVFPDAKDKKRDGAWLGIGTQPGRMQKGDVVTQDKKSRHYFFDPEMKIKGDHFLCIDRGNVYWTEIMEVGNGS